MNRDIEKEVKIDRVFDESVELKGNAMLKHRPELFNEWDFEKNDDLGLDIYKMTYGSAKKVYWNCPMCKSNYDMPITQRAGRDKANCPYCNGKRVNETNSLASLHPETMKEWNLTKNGKLTPDDVSRASNKTVWWICLCCESSYSMRISDKIIDNAMCPFCSNKKINHTNSLMSLSTCIVEQWCQTSNGNLTPDNIIRNSKIKVWWKCKICDSKYNMSVYNRAKFNRQYCPYCEDKKINESNCLATTMPSLSLEWCSIKNKKLTAFNVTRSSSLKVWWTCPKCSSDYDMRVNDRVRNNFNCPYCSGRRVNHTNSLASLNPELASEWHPTKNGDLTPYDVTKSKNSKVWWLGNCGHEWEASINSRDNKGNSCPYCSNRRILVGFNDMWTTNPELAKLLLNPEDGYKYTQMSSIPLDWRCPHCFTEIKKKYINSIDEDLSICPKCDDKGSFGERLMFSLLSHIDIDFLYDRTLSWSGRLRYDFYLPSHSCIIEVHGKQHYKEKTGNFRKEGKTLKEEQENDRLKEELAIENGIDKYIVIDARESSYEWIMISIKNSELTSLIDSFDGDLESFNFNIKSSRIRDIWRMWDEGSFSVNEISSSVKMHRSTVSRYLKLGRDLKTCSY